MLSTLLVAAAVLAAPVAAADWKAPWFCHDLNCPMYKVVSKTSKYEIRQYEPAGWVSTLVPGIDLDKAEETGFGRLFDYISGSNKEKKKVPMTCPVTNFIQPGQGPNCENNFTISFYLPYTYQGTGTPAPIPSAADVEITHTPKLTVATIAYGGWSDDAKVIEYAGELGNALVADKVKFDNSTYFTAGYDSPFRIFERHNEVWFKLM